VIASHSRHEKRSRTVWTTYHRRGIASSVSVMSSPSFDNLFESLHGQAVGAGITTRSRGRRSGNGFRVGQRRANSATWLDSAVRSAVSASSVAATYASSSSVQRPLPLFDHKLEMGDQRVGLRRETAALIASGVGRMHCSLNGV
jgi:hypothetical protein